MTIVFIRKLSNNYQFCLICFSDLNVRLKNQRFLSKIIVRVRQEDDLLFRQYFIGQKIDWLIHVDLRPVYILFSKDFRKNTTSQFLSNEIFS